MGKGYNGLAIASIILAFVIPIVGLILGIVAYNQINPKKEKGRELALAAIVLGGILTLLWLMMWLSMWHIMTPHTYMPMR